ncbi:MAG: hypothetical protein JNL82_09595 [Myxococcales bacterium]|nr:hypothetical protein [Myxococcales bacterium]
MLSAVLLASMRFSTLDYLIMALGFLDLLVAPLSLILLIMALTRRRGNYGMLKAMGILNLLLAVPIMVTMKPDGVLEAQVALWALVLVVLAIPSLRVKFFGAPPGDGDEDPNV